MEESFSISRAYEKSLEKEHRKNKGIYYTPKFIVDYILSKTIKNHDIINNPNPKIADIACGCGNFLLEVYDALYEIIEDNIDDLREKYDSEYWKEENIHNHIVSNCIYGYDIDEDAINILKEQLQNKNEYSEVDKFNLYTNDSLKEEFNIKFDYIVGNPPYVGHKQLDKEYRKFLLEGYRQVYKGKSDLYFCFYKKIIDTLKPHGVASIITPRYFLESPSGKDLRNYIENNSNLIEIIDFSGGEIFKNIGVCSCISTFVNEKSKSSTNIYRNENEDPKETINLEEFEEFYLRKYNDQWLILQEKDEDFYNKIQEKATYKLGDIVESFQGIITGCDKAFILKNDNTLIPSIQKEILKPWIKNKDISKYKVEEPKYKLLYSNDIKKPKEYRLILDHIEKYKEKLLNRRECIKGMRKWYELQWGREKTLFEQIKIVYPYKARENKFAIDYKNNFCSADVYSFYIKEKYKYEFSYEYLIGILNSKAYNKYFKIIGKHMSKNIYDYYPNKVMELKIFKDHNYNEIENTVKEILLKISNNENIEILQSKLDSLIESSLELK